MSKFVFPLEKVLKYRLSVEEAARQAMAEAQERYDLNKRILDEMYKTYESSLVQDDTGAEASWVIRQNNYRLYLAKCIEKQQELLSGLQNEINEVRAKLIRAWQERSILEKVREKSYHRYQLEEKNKEKFQNDETGQSTFVYHKRGHLL
ncbi:MAG: Flagellar export protein FliJ [Desulfotomaculum sp. 46_296]|nr:MAG: Flagellar export protein FliJ [Desulfotomaculum sp. 46_296]HAU32310.1 flagellar export protein FliJ [Desulfotomaculum sp.]